MGIQRDSTQLDFIETALLLRKHLPNLRENLALAQCFVHFKIKSDKFALLG
jgi:hypothetical protein